MPSNAAAIKQINRENVLAFVYTQHSTTQKAIKDTLQLSRSTIIQILKEFEDQNLIVKRGHLESTGGRRASSLYFSRYAKIAIGVELLAGSYEIVALDLYGETIKCERFDLPYENTDRYYETVCHSVQALIDSLTQDPDKILGVGIVLQGLISNDGTQVTYGKILGCTGLRIDVFTRHLPYPCQFFHDAEAATLDELWQSPGLKNAIYIHIRSNMSGAIVVNRQSLIGTELKSGVFEHMTIVPNGKPCYCGNCGCLDTYCSTIALLHEGETLDSFFHGLRTGDLAVRARWMEYLHYLALAINNLHMMIDCPIILGGTIAKFLQGSDLKLLHQFIHDNTAFPTEREFIRVTCCPDSPISRGAALPAIKKYLHSILGHDFVF
ncbi:ROK family transcriptional regulator [Intestinibacillus sp. Marseille-P6563]|uniref:ROK family transcriptional regulator n=1 Tax=Intestinibacillus sp. Marseille-P6563 TaxID=2364792 RepID=UPI000F05826A|nr:ROK family transcriptional regulator [Intestinibacillus sp. Marseille-P6563]